MIDPAIVSRTAATVPTVDGVTFSNADLNLFNSFIWNRKAYRESEKAGHTPGVDAAAYANATVCRWMTSSGGVRATLHSIKRPLESRVWFAYRNPEGGLETSFIGSGTLASPVVTARVLDGGQTAATRASYNAQGRPTEVVDPVGRTTRMAYFANGVDLQTLKQIEYPGGVRGAEVEHVLASYSGYVNHQPTTAIDAAGQTTTTAYNAIGQPTTITNALAETTTMVYDADGFLEHIDGPLPGDSDKTSFTYDAVGRVRTVTDSQGYTTTTDYDALNRPTVVTYPDGTTTETIYLHLDAHMIVGRDGKTVTQYHNAIRQVEEIHDPEGRVTKFDYCTCSALNSLTDANGNITRWLYDVQGRVTKKIYADNTEILYEYETKTSRLKKVTDAMGQETIITYTLDGKVESVSYANAVNATPGTSYTYDPVFGRRDTVVGQFGTTTFEFNPFNAVVGAGQLKKLIQPVADTGVNAEIEYTYDELGRVLSRSIDGVANTVAYDELGRVETETNPLGTFTYDYVEDTGRLNEVSSTSGPTTQFEYWPKDSANAGQDGNGDFRLKSIKHFQNANNGGHELATFDYSYTVDGQIKRWGRKMTDGQSGGAVLLDSYFDLAYDNANQLTVATLRNSQTTDLIKRYGYVYDKSGNRVSQTIEDSSGTQTIDSGLSNNLNQLTAANAVGQSSKVRVVGSVDKDAKVKLNGKQLPQYTDAAGIRFFNGELTVPTGAADIQFDIEATDFQTPPNTLTKRYSSPATWGLQKSYQYDLNGNLIAEYAGPVKSRAYKWDALDRLIEIDYTPEDSVDQSRTEFVYDAAGRRSVIREFDAVIDQLKLTH